MILGTGARREPNQEYIKTRPDISYFGVFSVIFVLLLCLCVSALKSFFAFDETISDKDWEHENWLF